MDCLPLFCRLANKAVLLVGGGVVAERKARLLLDAGAQITLVAPDLCPALHQLAVEHTLTWLEEPFTPHHLDNVWLVIAATNQREVNQQVFDEASARHLFCNVVDDPELSSVVMPSIVDRSPLQIAISSAGNAPVLARLLREQLEALLPHHLGHIAQFAGRWRERVKATLPAAQRRHFWERLLGADRLGRALARGDETQAETLARQLLSASPAAQGEVVLVGAGPGDPGLLTLHALHHLQQADVVIYDRLVSRDILALVRRDARQLFVGKERSHHSVPQEEINQWLMEEASKGHKVVRLKGGDPFIFGRGGEELEILAESGISFQVIPGITAASGCAAYAGIPLTHRDHAQSVRFVSIHGRAGALTLDWHSLADKAQTLVFYMGLSQCPLLREQLIQAGMQPDTPAALIEQGTLPSQRVIYGTLASLPALANDVASPALIIVGSVVTLGHSLAWFGQHQTPTPPSLDQHDTK